jgi:hypothetical protein
MLITYNIMLISESYFNNVNKLSFFVNKRFVVFTSLLRVLSVIAAFFLVINLLTPLILLLVFN